ncbi:MAG: helix-turn-helix transcriptional regulator [Saprospiraceae bacterium]|nr:helix-turn-helix transcriptional regulator [Saprospiraceae bacterium]HNL38087.1 helix-turn-helix transcriptional regulator [Saprospiraceae bacterium]
MASFTSELLLKIRSLRARRKLSQTELADHLGISQPAYSKIEAGETDIKLSHLESISTALDIPLDQLIVQPVDDLVQRTA